MSPQSHCLEEILCLFGVEFKTDNKTPSSDGVFFTFILVINEIYNYMKQRVCKGYKRDFTQEDQYGICSSSVIKSWDEVPFLLLPENNKHEA